MQTRTRWISLVTLAASAALTLGLAPGAARADGSLSNIGGAALSGVQGWAGVNEASGSNNAQANAGAVAMDLYGGAALASLGSLQEGASLSGNVTANAAAAIGGSAFANAVGVISVNQASGLANVQGNGIAIGLGGLGSVVSDNQLAASSAGAPGSLELSGSQSVSISDGAFAGSSGVLQVNQAAGAGNVTRNSFALRVQPGAAP